jgi:hypothetical protein
MAEHASDYHRGEMDVHAQASTYNGFVKFSKWGSLALAALLVALITWFCTPAGFLPGLVAFVVVLVAGIAILREKKDGPAH